MYDFLKQLQQVSRKLCRLMLFLYCNTFDFDFKSLFSRSNPIQ